MSMALSRSRHASSGWQRERLHVERRPGSQFLVRRKGRGSQGLFHSWRKGRTWLKCTRNWSWRRWLLLSVTAGMGNNACACRRISTTLKKRSLGCLRKFSAVEIFNATPWEQEDSACDRVYRYHDFESLSVDSRCDHC